MTTAYRNNNGFTKISPLTLDALEVSNAEGNAGLGLIKASVGIFQPTSQGNYIVYTQESWLNSSVNPAVARVPLQLPAKAYVLTVSLAGAATTAGPLAGGTSAALARGTSAGSINGNTLCSAVIFSALTDPGGHVQTPTTALAGGNDETFVTADTSGTFDGKGVIVAKIIWLDAAQ